MFNIRDCDFMTKKAIITYDRLNIIETWITFVYRLDDTEHQENINSIHNTFAETQALREAYTCRDISSKQFLRAVAKAIKPIKCRDLINYIQTMGSTSFPNEMLDEAIELVRDCFIWVSELTEDDDSDCDNAFCSIALDKIIDAMTPETLEPFRHIVEESE